MRAASVAGISSPVSRYRFACSKPMRYTHMAVVGVPHTRAGG